MKSHQLFFRCVKMKEEPAVIFSFNVYICTCTKSRDIVQQRQNIVAIAEGTKVARARACLEMMTLCSHFFYVQNHDKIICRTADCNSQYSRVYVNWFLFRFIQSSFHIKWFYFYNSMVISIHFLPSHIS